MSRVEVWKHQQCGSTRQTCSRATDMVCVKQTLGLILCHIWWNDEAFGKTERSLGQPDPVWMCGWFCFKNAYAYSPCSPSGSVHLTPLPGEKGFFQSIPSVRARPSIVHTSWDPAWSLTASVSPHPDDRNRPAIPPQGQIKEERNRKRYSQKFSFINLFL